MVLNFALSLALVSALAINVQAQRYECPNGYDKFLDKCYVYHLETHNFAASEAHCATLHPDGHLASIPSQQVQDFIKTTYFDVYGKFFWIGLNDRAAEGVWVWTDGTPYSYSNWGVFRGKKLPEVNAAYNCASINDETETLGDWSDAACNGFAHHLCQIPATLETTKTTTKKPKNGPTPNPGLSCYGEMIRHGDMCYRLTRGLKTWQKALKFCKDVLKGATLATINSADVQNFLFHTYMRLHRHGMWIGLNSQASVGRWTWIEDSSSPSYENWARIRGTRQPENVWNKRCVAMDNTRKQFGKWNDHKCTMKAWSICQKPAS